MLGVPNSVWIASLVILILVCWLTFWTLNKAYSKKWEDDGDHNREH